MNTIFEYKPGFKFRIREDVYAFNENGLFSTEEESLKEVLEKSPPFLSGEMKKKSEPFRIAVKLYSHILDGYLWVVQDSNDWPGLKEKEEPVYDAKEIKELQGMDLTPEELKAVHEVKKAFKGTIQGQK